MQYFFIQKIKNNNFKIFKIYTKFEKQVFEVLFSFSLQNLNCFSNEKNSSTIQFF
jgi:hypothetical protein